MMSRTVVAKSDKAGRVVVEVDKPTISTGRLPATPPKAARKPGAPAPAEDQEASA
jgi:hypothetical protein